MSDFGKRIESLTPEKRAVLEEWLLKGGAAEASRQTIGRRKGAGPACLSFGQRWLWVLAQMVPECFATNEPTAIRLTGELDVESLRRALSEILRRHEALRTSYEAVDGRPAQIVAAPEAFDLAMEDLSGLDARRRDEEAQRLIALDAWRPFDLSRAPMMRGRLLRLSCNDHALVIVTHHIATDGWSSGVLFRELSVLYDAFCQGRSSPLPELPVQYADYAAWLVEKFDGGALEKESSYWERRLAGAAPLELPTDRPRPTAQTFRGNRREVALPRDLVAAIETFARDEGVTLFVTLLAAYKALLQRYTGQKDIVVGAPVAGRSTVEFEPLIGLFANMLALRTDFSGDPTFRRLVRYERDSVLEALTHQDMPFEKLVEKLLPKHDLSRPPLVQAVFAYLDSPYSQLSLAGLEWAPFTFERKAAKFELVLFMGRDGDGLSCAFEYNSDLFDADTIGRMAEHFGNLLRSAITAPDTPVSRLPIMCEAERRRIVVEWNDTRTEYPRDKCVHEVFEAQADRSPGSPAAVFGGGQITYGQLETRSNKLANYLRGLGVGPDAPAAVSMEQSIEFIVAILGILKAGSAYAPIDPTFPRERVQFMLEDTRARVILTQKRFAEKLPQAGAKQVFLDADWHVIERESSERREGSARPDSTACVIYTSGSTGTPKGALITHRAINRLVLNTNYADIRPGDRMAQASIISFDAATLEIWGALLNGAALVGAGKQVLLSADEMREFIRDNGITVMFLTTSIFNHFARSAPGIFAPLRWLMFGGEAADAACARMVLENNPPKVLLNGYGPTEATTFASCYRVAEVPARASGVPIGRPIANTQVYILDAHFQPVPVGVAGEICIGGDGVAAGYLNRPDLTAERFIRDPFGGDPDGRLYRTGDVGRFLGDGNIEFLGRADDQIKIRGFRIEPGEIETTLGRHPLVGECAVVSRTDNAGEKGLLAYVSPRGAQPPTARELRKFLEDRLPDFMVPSAFAVLERIPHTASGKIDRRNLPAPDGSWAADERSFVPARTPVEEALARIWSEALNVEKVGVTDDFFESGGHSLLAARLFAQIEKVFGLKLPLATLFAAPTVEKLAEAMRTQGRADLFPPIVTIEKGGGDALFGIATADAFIYAGLARGLGPSQSFYALHPQGIIPVEKPVIDIRNLAARYVEEIRRVQAEGPYRLAGMCAGGVVAYEMAQQLVAAGQEVNLVAMIDTGGPFGMGLRLALRLRRLGRTADHAATHAVTLWRLSPDKRGEYLRTLVQRYKRRVLGQPAPPAGVDRDVPVERAYWMAYNGAYLDALARYTPRPYRGKLVLFVAEKAESPRFAKERLKWQRLALGGADVYEIPGFHSQMLDQEQANAIAGHLKRYLKNPERE